MTVCKHCGPGIGHNAVSPEPSPVPLAHLEYNAMLARYEKARALVGKLAAGTTEFRMSVPADRTRDTDLILADALDDIPRLIRIVLSEGKHEAAESRHLANGGCMNPACAECFTQEKENKRPTVSGKFLVICDVVLDETTGLVNSVVPDPEYVARMYGRIERDGDMVSIRLTVAPNEVLEEIATK